MSLIVKYSLNSEKKLVNNLFKNYYFFKKGYLFRFPMNLDARLAPRKVILSALPKEYNPKEYKKFSDFMVKRYAKIGERFEIELKKIFKRVPKNFNLIITQYGPAGYFIMPNSVILNFKYDVQGQEYLKPFDTILHEIVHMMIQPYINKYKIEHFEKERTVELILHSRPFAFLKNQKMPAGWQVKKYIDPLFKKMFFVSPEKYFRNIKYLRPK